MTIHALVPQCTEPREQCFELFKMQNSPNFLGLHPWTPLWRDYSAPQTPQLYNGFSPCYACRKTNTPQKLLAAALEKSHFFAPRLHFLVATKSLRIQYLCELELTKN